MNFLDFLEAISYLSFLLSLLIVKITEFKIEDINQNFSFKVYSIAIFIFISLLASSFFIIRRLFNLLKFGLNSWKIDSGDISYLNNYLYLGIAIMLLTLFVGYYYVFKEPGNKLKNFLIVLSFALINSFAAVSALKSITKIN